MIMRLNFVLVIGLNLTVYSRYGHGEIGNNATDLYLIGLFPLSGLWDGGKGMLPAAEMAVDDINSRSDILPGYRLNMKARDTGCDRGLGIKAFVDTVRQPTTNIMIIGAGCSGVSQVVAQAAHHWNLVQMVENLETRSKRANIKVINKGGFTEDPAGTLQSIRQEDARIIVGGFYTDKARRVFCAAYYTGFYGKKVWVTPETVSQVNDWWNETDPSINCTADQLREALEGTLVVSNIYTNMNETEEGLTGLSLQSFRKTYKKRTRNMTQPVTAAEQAPIAYDTVWAAALALNKTMNNLTESGSKETLTDFSYKNKKMADLLKAKLREDEFTSVSGPVSFTKGGEGIRLIGIDIFRGSSFVRVGIYDRNKRMQERLELDIDAIWKGEIPKDSRQTLEVLELVPLRTYVIMTSLASLGIILALLFLGFNVFYRNMKIIRMSSPNINNIILLGCILAYLSVYIEDISGAKYSVYCQVKASLLLLAFSLSFGALFAKTWRIHRIFTASRVLKKQIIKDFSLCLMILGLVCLNTLVMTVWFVVDPQTILTKLKPNKEVSDDVIIHHLYTYCSSDKENYFLITILAIQGILLFLGVFLAWETRKVPFSILNESRYIGMCIYNVVTLGVVGAFVSLTLRSSTTLVYIVVSCITILCTTVTQCLLFVPKILAHRDFVRGKLTNASISSNPALTASLRTQTGGNDAGIQTDFADAGETQARGINAATQTDVADAGETKARGINAAIQTDIADVGETQARWINAATQTYIADYSESDDVEAMK